MATTVAGLDPLRAPKNIVETCAQMANPPRKLPTMHMTHLTIRLESPPAVMRLAARTKKGMDMREKVSMPANIFWEKMVTLMLPKKTTRNAAGRLSAMKMGTRQTSSKTVRIIKAQSIRFTSLPGPWVRFPPHSTRWRRIGWPIPGSSRAGWCRCTPWGSGVLR